MRHTFGINLKQNCIVPVYLNLVKFVDNYKVELQKRKEED